MAPTNKNSYMLTVVDKWVLIGLGIAFVIANIFMIAFGSIPFTHMGMATVLGAGFTIFIYSFLYKDNPYYKIIEHLYIGVGLGWGLLMTWYHTLWPEILKPFGIAIGDMVGFLGHALSGAEGVYQSNYEVYNLLNVQWAFPGNMFLIIPITLGTMMYFIFSRKWRWLARYPIAISVGFGTGFGMPMLISAHLFTQAEASIKTLFQDLSSSEAIFNSINETIVVIIILSVLIYFFFSIEHKSKALRYTSAFGIISLMVAFGATFGYTIMARLSLLVERVQFLLETWLGVI